MRGKDQAYWLADKIPSYGDYAKEAANVLRRQADDIESMHALLSECAPHVFSAAEAEHLLDGFRPQRRPMDDLVARVRAAFAEIGYSKEQTELEYGKPVSEWLDRDIPDIRETLKALRTSKSSL